VRYAYGTAAAILLGGAAATLTLNPVGAQTAQNEPGTIASAAPRPGAPMSFADLAARLQPAVVNISTRQSIELPQRQTPPGLEDFFRRFGVDVPEGGGGPVTRRGQSLGSGFIISPDGYVVTNNHVVAPARTAGVSAVVESITVTLDDRTEYEAELVGRDEVSDLALLKIDAPRPLPFVRFGDSTRIRVGDWVVAMGSPYELSGTVTAGIVSALHRNIRGLGFDRFIQTDASINSGNSGGPLFDLNGNVVGINTALFSPTGGNVGIGFAIPAEQAGPVIEALRRGERVQRGYIGVSLNPIEEVEARALGIERNRGELINSVTAGAPADRAGIRAGDVVISVAGQPVTPDQTLAQLVSQQPIGARVPLEVVRQGRRLTIPITIALRPPEDELQRLASGAEPEEGTPPSADGKDGPDSPAQRSAEASLGLGLETLTPELARRLQLPDPNLRGVVVGRVDPNSDAGQRGVRPGFVIVAVNQRPTPTPEAVAEVVRAARSAGRDSVLLLVQVPGQPLPQHVGVRLSQG